MSIHLQLPSKLAQRDALDFCCSLNQYSATDEIILDVSSVRWAFPFGSLVIASQVRRLRNQGGVNFELVGFDPHNKPHSYLSHIGFFKLLGFDIGNAPGEACGGDSYLPFTILDCNELAVAEYFGESPMHRAIQKKADEFAALLTQSRKLTVVRPVSYCIRELARNVFEHSECHECILGGQRYSDGRVLVGIVDHGRGLRASLEESFAVGSDTEALKMAIRPGISRSLSDDEDNPWANSGFGLYVLSELGRKTGYFSIVSGDSVLEKTGDTTTGSNACHNGTAINIIFTKPHGENLELVIEAIIKQGEEATKTGGTPRRASKSSKTM